MNHICKTHFKQVIAPRGSKYNLKRQQLTFANFIKMKKQTKKHINTGQNKICYPFSPKFQVHVIICNLDNIYLHHHEDLGRRLNDVIETTDVLVTQILHSLNLHLDPG